MSRGAVDEGSEGEVYGWLQQDKEVIALTVRAIYGQDMLICQSFGRGDLGEDFLFGERAGRFLDDHFFPAIHLRAARSELHLVDSIFSSTSNSAGCSDRFHRNCLIIQELDMSALSDVPDQVFELRLVKLLVQRSITTGGDG